MPVFSRLIQSESCFFSHTSTNVRAFASRRSTQVFWPFENLSTRLQTLDAPGFPVGWEESHPLLIVLGIFLFLVFSRRAQRTLSNTVWLRHSSVSCHQLRLIETRQMKRCVVRDIATLDASLCVNAWREERSWELQIFGLFALIFMFSPQWKTTLKRTLLTHLTMYYILLKNASLLTFLSAGYMNYFRGVHKCHFVFVSAATKWLHEL